MSGVMRDSNEYILISVAEVVGYLAGSPPVDAFSVRMLELASLTAVPEYVDYGRALLLYRAKMLPEDAERLEFVQRALELLDVVKEATTCLTMNPVQSDKQKSLTFFGPEAAVEMVVGEDGWFGVLNRGAVMPDAVRLAEQFDGRMDGEFVFEIHDSTGGRQGIAGGSQSVFRRATGSPEWIESGLMASGEVQRVALEEISQRLAQRK